MCATVRSTYRQERKKERKKTRNAKKKINAPKTYFPPSHSHSSTQFFMLQPPPSHSQSSLQPERSQPPESHSQSLVQEGPSLVIESLRVRIESVSAPKMPEAMATTTRRTRRIFLLILDARHSLLAVRSYSPRELCPRRRAQLSV